MFNDWQLSEGLWSIYFFPFMWLFNADLPIFDTSTSLQHHLQRASVSTLPGTIHAIKMIFKPTVQKLWFSRHYSIFIIWSKKGKIKSEHHCVKGPVICLSLCWQPNDTHSSILNNIYKKQKSFKQVLNKTDCD